MKRKDRIEVGLKRCFGCSSLITERGNGLFGWFRPKGQCMAINRVCVEYGISEGKPMISMERENPILVGK